MTLLTPSRVSRSLGDFVRPLVPSRWARKAELAGDADRDVEALGVDPRFLASPRHGLSREHLARMAFV